MSLTPDYEYIEAEKKFNAYYNEEILPILNEREKIRVYKLKIFLVCSFISLFWLYVHYVHILAIENISGPIEEICKVIDIIFALITGWPVISYYHKTKNKILPVLVKFFGDFEYDSKTGLSKKIIDDSLILEEYKELKNCDSFSGKYKDVPVNIMEYYTTVTEVRHEKDGTHITSKTKEEGILFYVRMNKEFNGQTIILSDSILRKIFNKINRKNTGTGKNISLESVRIESPEFEKIFDIYSDNQIEARYILTPVMLEYIMELTKRFPKVKLSFYDNHVLLNIAETKNMFECTSFFRTLINYRRIRENFSELYHLFKIVDTLRLHEEHFL